MTNISQGSVATHLRCGVDDFGPVDAVCLDTSDEAIAVDCAHVRGASIVQYSSHC